MCIHHLRVELPASFMFDLCEGFVSRPGVLVGSSVGERVESVGHRDDAGSERDRLTSLTVRVSLAVPALVVVSRDGPASAGAPISPLQKICSESGVARASILFPTPRSCRS